MIPFLDLKTQYAGIKPEIDAAVLRVLESGQYVLGPEVAAFEAEFAAYCGAKHAIAVNSGTSALHLALLAAGIGPGDEVITTPFTFVATVSAIVSAGASPVLVDIDPVTFTLDPSRVEAALSPRTRAIIPVHLYGQMADMEPIMALARHFGLAVIEDACQAHGAEYFGQRAGSIGTSGCFSFYPGKNLGAYGEAGIVVTNSDDHMQAIRTLRDWGQEERYHHVVKGYNYRMDAIQAAILRVKLTYLEHWTELRRRHALTYADHLADQSELALPVQAAGRRHVYHVFATRTKNRAASTRALREEGVQTGLHYPIPVHLQPAHADLGYRRGDFPNAEAAADEVLSLPMFPELTDEQIGRVSRLVRGGVYAAQ